MGSDDSEVTLCVMGHRDDSEDGVYTEVGGIRSDESESFLSFTKKYP